MSQLGQQLAQLKSVQTAPKQGALTKPSVLYSAKESASYDLDHVYFLALQGFKRLQIVDSGLKQLETLISPQYKGIARGTFTQVENEELNSLLKSSLLVLSSYFLHEECLQIIEYLLRNFLVHQYLPNETTIYFIQYHSFPLYTRLLQNIVDDHRQQNDMLGFLYTSISKGETLTRSQIIKQMAVDYRLLKQLVEFTYTNVSQIEVKSNEYVVNVIPQNTSLVATFNQRKPDNLSFLYSILQELQQTTLAQNYIENIRGGLGKLIQVLLNQDKEEYFSFIYLVLTLYLKGSRQWLSVSQLESVAEIITQNFAVHRKRKLVWEVLTILSTVLQSQKLLYLIVANIHDNDLNSSVSLSTNQYLLQQLLKLFLNQQESTYSTLLLKWTLNVLQVTKSRLFVDALVLELKSASNLEFANLIHTVCVAYLTESKIYKQYFTLPSQQLTVDNVEAFSKTQGLQTFSAAQFQSLVNQIHLLMVKQTSKIPQLLSLLQEVLRIQKTKFQQAQVYSIKQFESAMKAQQGKLNKTKLIIHIAYLLFQQENDEMVKFSAISQISISQQIKLDDLVGQFTTLDLEQDNNQQWLQNIKSDLFPYLLDLISKRNHINHQLLYLNQVLSYTINAPQVTLLIKAIQNLIQYGDLKGANHLLVDDLVDALFIKYQEQSTQKISYLKLILLLGGLATIMKSLASGESYLVFDLIRIFYDSLNAQPTTQENNNLRITILAILSESGTHHQTTINHFIVTMFYLLNHLNSDQQKIYMLMLSKFVEQNKGVQKIQALPMDSSQPMNFEHALIKQLLFKAEKSKTQLQSSSQAFIQFIVADQSRREAFIDLGVLVISQSNDEQSILSIQSQIINKCFSVLQKSDQKQIKKFTLDIESLIKQNQLFGLSILLEYFKLLSINEKPSYEIFGSLISDVDGDTQLNDIIQDGSFDACPLKLKAQIISKVSQCKGDQHVYMGTIDVEMLIQSFSGTNPYQQTEYLKNILVSNISQLSEEQLSKILHSNQEDKVLQLVELCKAYIIKNNAHKLPLHEPIHNLLVRFVKQHQFDCQDPQTYHILNQLIDLQAIMMKYQFKKQVFQSLVQFFEQQINKEISATNGLLLIRMIILGLNKHVPRFFHNARYSYFLAATLLLTHNHLKSTNAQPTSLILQNFEGFKPEELWVIIYLLSKHEFTQQFTAFMFNHLKSLDTTYYFAWANALGESLMFSWTKDSRLSQKSLKVKSKKIKYQIFQLQKIIGKSLHVIKNVFPSTLKQNTLKKQIFNTLNFFGVIFDNVKKSVILDSQQQNIIYTIKSLHKIEKWYPDSKVGALALKKKTQLVALLNMEFLLQALNNYSSIQSIQKLLLYAFNQQIETSKLKITPKFLSISLVYVENIPSTKSEAIQFLQTVSLQFLMRRKAFAEHLMVKNIEASKTLFQYLMGLLGSNTISIEHKIKVIDILSVAVQFDRYLLLPYADQILQCGMQLMLNVGKDEKLSYHENTQLQRMSQYLGLQYNNTYSVIDYQLLSGCMERFIVGFGGTISKDNLVKIILLVTSFNHQQCVDAILSKVEPRILITILPQLVQQGTISSISVQNLCIFLAQLFKSLSVEMVSQHYTDLMVQVIELLNYPKVTFVETETENAIFIVDGVENEIILTLIALVLKMNDIQLKKAFNMLIQWARSKDEVGGYNFKEFNKLTFFKVVSRLSNQLGPFFTKYFGYIFESLLNFFTDFHGIFSQKKKKQIASNKRQHDEPDMYYKLYILQCRHALQCVEQMCFNDKDDFIDTEKFERLSQPLALVLDCPRVNEQEKLTDFIEDWVSSAILQVFQLVNDDFKWKTIHYHILQVLQKHSVSDSQGSVDICISIITILSKLVDVLQDRYTVLVNDLVPYLHNLSQSQTQSEELQTLITQLVTKLSKITGEEIGTSLKSARIK